MKIFSRCTCIVVGACNHLFYRKCSPQWACFHLVSLLLLRKKAHKSGSFVFQGQFFEDKHRDKILVKVVQHQATFMSNSRHLSRTTGRHGVKLVVSYVILLLLTSVTQSLLSCLLLLHSLISSISLISFLLHPVQWATRQLKRIPSCGS